MNDTGTLSARLEAFRDTTLAFKRLGYDRFGAAALVAEMAGKVHGTALDVGTGKAVMASTLAAFSGAPVVTVDIDDSDRDLAALVAFEAGVADRIRYVRADATNLPFSDGQFGCAVTMDMLHHVVDAEGVTRELARVIARDGVLVVADFTEEGFHFANGRGMKRVGIAFCVTLIREAQQLGRLLQDAGFEPHLVCCRVGAIDYAEIGLPKAHPERFAAICNPVAQARLLNDDKVDLVVQIGLCIGHDLVLQDVCDAPVTTLVVKDRVYDHHSIRALRCSVPNAGDGG